MSTRTNITDEVTTASVRLVVYLAMLSLALACGGSTGVAEDQDDHVADPARAQWRRLYVQIAAGWRVEIPGDDTQELTLQRERTGVATVRDAC
ncbi:MAG: hypothetical protein KDA75_11370, partial [Planctomycetaceae bacterium]|nr:hypothetical protein [Planctomycetaceae bacterium]